MNKRLGLCAFLVAVTSAVRLVRADPRPFTFSSDTYSVGKGQFEYEQWVSYQHHKEDDSGFDRVNIRHEIEFGLADNFDLAIYLPSWHYEDSSAGSEARFDSIDVEGVYYLTNPVRDFVGIGLYGEVQFGEGSLGLETKLLVQKDIGNWVFVYNLVLETEIEGIFADASEENEVEGELAHTFAAAYNLPGTPIFLGGEAVIESIYEDWSHYEGTTVYAGPVLSYQGDPFWVTLTPVFQLTDQADEPDFQLRMIAGWQF